MRAVDIIRKKRDGKELSAQELSYVVRGYSSGVIPDYQMSALLMAIFLRGMTGAETAALAEEMRCSGTVLDLSDIPGLKVDKHSTGGVGDKTSLVIAPAVAAAGVIVPMISGRGLGHTGGTLDKLESIPGFQVHLSPEDFKKQLAEIHVALMGQTRDLVPADRKLYALRDVTSTVESYPLIASSIMSKKLAEDIDGLVLDIKTGSGAFMKGQAEAETLAGIMVELGSAFGAKVTALITDMNQPLGELVGNSLEVIECLEVLKGRGPSDLVNLCQELSAHCLLLGGAALTLEAGRNVYRDMISSGRALEKFRQIVRCQKGNVAAVDDYSILPHARHEARLSSPAGGFISAMDTEKIGIAMCVLGAGRETVESVIDPAVGMRVEKKIGDHVEAGEPLATIYYDDEGRYQDARGRLLECYAFSKEAPPRPSMIKKILG